MDDKKINELESTDKDLDVTDSKEETVEENPIVEKTIEEEKEEVVEVVSIEEPEIPQVEDVELVENESAVQETVNSETIVEPEIAKEETEEFVSEEPAVQEVVEPKVVETINQEYSVNEDKEPTKEFDIVGNKEPQQDPIKEEPKKKSKKKLILILSLVLLLVVAIVVVVVLFLNKDKKKDPEKPKEPEVVEPTISDEEAQQVMTEYGNKLVIFVREHIAQGFDVATIKQEAVSSLVEGYTVSCEEFTLENNGNVKLDKCKINNSEAKYSFEKTYSTKPDSNYLISSKNGVLTFYYDEWSAIDEKEFKEYEYSADDYDKFVIKCEESSCVLDKFYVDHAIVKEESGKASVYHLKNKKKIYTALAGYELNFLGQYDSEYNEKAIGIIIRNPEAQEALYSIEKKKIVVDFGLYTFDWDNIDMCYTCDTSVVNSFIRVHKGNLTGLISASTFEEVLEPGDYKNLTAGDKYVFIQDNKYYGVMKYNAKTKKVEMLIKPNKYTNVDIKEDFVYVENEDKYGVYDGNTGKQLLNGKYYDAVIVGLGSTKKAFVLDGEILKILDLDGNMIKKVGNVPAEVHPANDILGYGSGSYEAEEGGIVAYLKLTNHEYDPDANDEYDRCYSACELENPDDDCDSKCDHLYSENAYADCVEYVYNFSTNKLEKEPAECEGGYAKPVLYLYPTLPSFINVTFEYPENLTTTYPKYDNGWNVLAKPNGDLLDLNGKYYYALYWEEDGNHTVDFSEGFYVTKNNAIDFLEEKLTKLGFNDRERNEFIMYWLPILEKNERSLVYFELTEERDSYSKININPKPDSLLRVAIHIKKVDSYTPIKEQYLPKFERKGFVAVEWGGVLY
jgi:hypothetical protein